MPENKEIEKASSDPVAIAIDKAKPIIAKVSFGSVIGFCSGYTIKQVGKVAAIVLGAGFIAVQTCVSYGYIQVDWGKVKGDAIKKVDTVSVQLYGQHAIFHPYRDGQPNIIREVDQYKSVLLPLSLRKATANG